MCSFRTAFLFFAFLFTGIASAQDPLLKKYSDSLRFCKVDSVRKIYNDSFSVLLKNIAESDEGFDLNTDSIFSTISVLKSPDGKMKVFSWVYINDKEEYFNHCLVMYRSKPNREHLVFWLNDRIDARADSVYDEFGPDQWPGALYYQMYQFKVKNTTMYCVLGFDGKNSFNNRKIIDVLWVDKDRELHIGAPVFFASERDYSPKYRVFFEYADQTTMLLRFEMEMKLITFSNLVPSSPDKLGLKQYYIPDGRIDTYQLKKKGKWVYTQGLEEFEFKGNE